jgi:hypothetical protein
MIFGVDLGSLGIGICGIALLCVGLLALGAYVLLRVVNYFLGGGAGRTPRRRVNRQVQAQAYQDPFARADEDFDIALRQVQGGALPQMPASVNAQSAYSAQNMPPNFSAPAPARPMNPNLNPNMNPNAGAYRKPSMSAGRAYAPYNAPNSPANPGFPPANPNFPPANPNFAPANPSFPPLPPLAPNFASPSPSENPLGDLPAVPPSLRDERSARRPRRDGGEEYFDEWSAGNLFDG